MLKKTVFLSILFLFLFSQLTQATTLEISKNTVFFSEDFDIDNVNPYNQDLVNNYWDYGSDGCSLAFNLADWNTLSTGRAYGYNNITDNELISCGASGASSFTWYWGFLNSLTQSYPSFTDGYTGLEFVFNPYFLSNNEEVNGDVGIDIGNQSNYFILRYYHMNKSWRVINNSYYAGCLNSNITYGIDQQVLLITNPVTKTYSLFVDGGCDGCCNVPYVNLDSLGTNNSRLVLTTRFKETPPFTNYSFYIDNLSIYSYSGTTLPILNTTDDVLKNLSITQNLDELLSMGNALNSYGKVFIGVIICIVIIAYLLFNGIGGKSPLLFIIVFTVLLINTLVILGLFPSWLFILEIIVIAVIGAVLLYGVLVR